MGRPTFAWMKIAKEFGLIFFFLHASHSLTAEEAVKRFFQYFKVENPVGIPVLNLPEPLELYTPLETVPITLVNATLSGHSKIKIEQAFIDLLSLTGKVEISVPRLEVNGNYSWPSVFFTSQGEMNSTMVDVVGHANFTLFVDDDYALQIKDMEIDQTSQEVFIDMTNLIWEHRLVVESNVIYVFFDHIVLEIFRQLRPFLISEINKEISTFFSTLPAYKHYVLEGTQSEEIQFKVVIRRLLQYLGMEPLTIPEKRMEKIGINFKVYDTVLHGLSVVGEVQKLFCSYQNKILYTDIALSYPKLLMYFNVEVDGGFMDFDVYEQNQMDNVLVKVKLMIDLSQETPPKVVNFDMYAQSVKKLRKGKSKWYSFITDGIRKDIVNHLPGPLTSILQEDLNKMDLEKEIVNLMKKVP